jgi:hypothetical protein
MEALMSDKLLNIHRGTELAVLSTEQLDGISIIDLHTGLLAEDAEKIPSIIQKLSDEKLLALLDLSSWEKDRFSPVNFATWLKVIFTLKEFEAIEQIRRLDQDELVLFLANILDIAWYDADKIYDQNPFITPDNVFVMFPKTSEKEESTGERIENELTQIAINMINLAYLDEGTEFGRRLCLDAMSVMYSTSEEETLRFRNARLSEEGLPTYIEALELFHYEDPKKLLSNILKMVGKEEYKKVSPDRNYLISSLTVVPRSYWEDKFNIPEDLLLDLQVELSALLTSAVVVNNAATENSKHISEIIERSKSYFDLGLELIKENSKIEILQLLEYVKLRHIFRLGFCLLIDIKRNASNVKAGLIAINRPDIIDADQKEFIEELLKPIPMFQKSLSDKAVQFESLEQLKEARKMLSVIADRLIKPIN